MLCCLSGKFRFFIVLSSRVTQKIAHNCEKTWNNLNIIFTRTWDDFRKKLALQKSRLKVIFLRPVNKRNFDLLVTSCCETLIVRYVSRISTSFARVHRTGFRNHHFASYCPRWEKLTTNNIHQSNFISSLSSFQIFHPKTFLLVWCGTRFFFFSFRRRISKHLLFKKSESKWPSRNRTFSKRPQSRKVSWNYINNF